MLPCDTDARREAPYSGAFVPTGGSPMPMRRVLWIALFGLPAIAAAETRMVRVFDADTATLARAGITASKAEDYGGFLWLELPETQLARLAASGLSWQADDDARFIHLGERRFDPLGPTPAVANRPVARAATGRALRLVQFHGPLRASWVRELETRGVTALQFVPGHALLVWAADSALDGARSLPFVRWAGDYAEDFRVDALATGASGLVDDVEVFFYENDDAARVAEAMRALGATVALLSPAQPDRRFWTARLTVPATAIPALAALPEVVHVSRRPEPTHDDELPNQIIATNVDGAGLPVTGYLDWLGAIGSSGGEGLGWAVVDSGADLDHPDLGPAWIGGANAPGCNTGVPGDDTGGHGTHVAGTILGRGLGDRSGPAQERDAQGFVYGQGVAPRAGLYSVRTIATGCSGLSDPDRSRIPLENGVHGSNNSWNNSSSQPRTTYGTSERTHDVMVRDGNFNTPETEPFVLVFSAGNAGAGAGTITGPKAAKNMIVVGSTANGRGGANFNLMSTFSSRGPLADGRLAPTLVAVGGNTASTRRVEGGSCATAITGTNNLYSTCSGTSMSTPMVSGGAILITEWWQARHGGQRPSPAMIKAILVASARDLPGASPGANQNDGSRPIPNDDEGWGIMNLKAAIAPEVRGVYRDQDRVLATVGEVVEYTVAAADPAEPLRIALVWTDAPAAASVGSGPALVNDLDLEVVSGPNTWRGNVFANGFSTPGGSFDNRNNIEQVHVQSPGAGTFTIRVRATALNGDALSGNGTPSSPRQDYALVCLNCVGPGFTLTSSAPTQGLCTGGGPSASFPLAVGSLAGFATPVTLAVGGSPTGASATFAPSDTVAPGGTATLVVGGPIAPGRYPLTLTGTAGPLTRSLPLTLEVGASIPATTSPVTPAAGATGLDRLPELSWAPVAGALAYDVEIATDAGFGTVVASARVAGTSFVPTTPLAAGTVHHWRVRAVNPCGASPWSAARSFTTVAAVCASGPLAIPDASATGVTSTLTGPAGPLAHLAVTVEATHARVGDLAFALRHVPSNTTARLATRHLNCQLANVAATFDGRATEFAQCFAGGPALRGTVAPQDPFAPFAGLDAAGPWELRATDEASGTTGQLDRWCVLPAIGPDHVFRDGFEP
jgi:subtilisin-like proprotein convertase family protein